MDTVPARHRGRNLYVHNPQVTLMRTTPEENARRGQWIAEKLNACDGPVRFLLPEGGVFPCTEDRFGAIARARVPYVGSCGALDMVNFGPMDTVPVAWKTRQS